MTDVIIVHMIVPLLALASPQKQVSLVMKLQVKVPFLYRVTRAARQTWLFETSSCVCPITPWHPSLGTPVARVRVVLPQVNYAAAWARRGGAPCGNLLWSKNGPAKMVDRADVTDLSVRAVERAQRTEAWSSSCFLCRPVGPLPYSQPGSGWQGGRDHHPPLWISSSPVCGNGLV